MHHSTLLLCNASMRTSQTRDIYHIHSLPEPAKGKQVTHDGARVGADLVHHLALALDGLEGKVGEEAAVEDAL